MNYDKKIVRMEKHLKEHPADYQTKISLMKSKSKRIDARRHQMQIVRLKKVAEARRKLREGYYA